MKKQVDEIFALLEKEDYFGSLNLCEELLKQFQTRFMDELTVNTATDYVGSVVLYSKICSAVKKPWLPFDCLESARGALRFLRDFMSDSDTLAESYYSFAEAYARGTFFPEAVSCYMDAARYFTSEDRALEALSNALYYQARFGKIIIEDLSFAVDKFGHKMVSDLQSDAMLEAKGQILIDPIESTEAFLRVRFEVEKITDEILSKKTDNTVPFCILYWNTKKNVLKNRFSIDWKSPSDMNPNIRFY